MHLHNFDLMTDTDINHLHALFMGSTGVNTDSRTIKPGEIFFAIKGENFDGNEYAEKALEAGAAYAIVSAGSAAAESAGKDSRIIPVEDTLYTLKALARTHRCQMAPGGKRLPVYESTPPSPIPRGAPLPCCPPGRGCCTTWPISSGSRSRA